MSEGNSTPAKASFRSEDVIGSSRIDLQMVQNVLVIWLDGNIDENRVDYRDTIAQLQCVVHTVHTFTDRDQSIDFLTDIQNENVCMIISDTLCKKLVPLIHDISQIQTIFLWGTNQTYFPQWAKDWIKVKGVFTEISSLCKALKQTVRQYEQNSISIGVVSTSEDLSKKNLDQLPPSFMYTQILKEVLLSINFQQKHFMEFIHYCREVFADNEGQLKHVNKLQREYNHDMSLWWYTYECFLYSMLNRALRLMDINIIIKIGFFICDLHRHIKYLHKTQFGTHNCENRFTLYRGQGLLRTDFEEMSRNKGGLIAFNNFLSTSRNREVPLLLAESNRDNPTLMGILFVITIDPSKSSTPFASLSGITQFETEDEVLFSMHAVFRIGDITLIGESGRVFQVELTLTSDDDHDLRRLTERIREETFSDSEGWHQLGLVLLIMGQSEKAQEVYETLLEQATEDSAKMPIYGPLGCAKDALGKYSEAIKFLQKSIEIQERTLPINYPALASSYGNIGNVYSCMGEYPKALSSFEKALAIQQQSLPSDHPDLASSYGNIGSVYNNMGDYPRALSSYKKTLAIQKQSLPLNHPDLAGSYNNIGSVYGYMNDYPKALLSYEKALAIRQRSLPLNHPDLATSYNSIGSVYKYMNDYPKALSFFEKALAIQQQSLPPNHSDLAGSYNNIGSTNFRMNDYPKALLFHEKALAIQQRSLPLNHPGLAISYNDIGLVYSSTGDYPKALLSYEKTLAILQQSLPLNHPYLATSYDNVGNVYSSMGDYPKALPSYEKALAIRQQSLPLNHPHLASSYDNIGNVYSSMGDHPTALLSYEKALAIRQQSLSPNHPDLASSYNDIGLVCFRMGHYPKALSFFEKAIAIQQQALPPNHPDLAGSYNNIGSTYSRMNDYSKALSFFEKALAVQQQLLPPNHPHLASSYNNVGVLYTSMGEYPKALSFFEKALAIRQESLPPNHPDLTKSHYILSVLYKIMGSSMFSKQ